MEPKRIESDDEWRIIEALLPTGWREEAREQKAFRRARYIQDPGDVLRLLLFHAVNAGGLRDTVVQASVAGLASMSDVALLKRMRTSVSWLRWIASELCGAFRDRPRLPGGLRLRAVDSTTIEGPANTTSEWRLHYTLDLQTLECDWHELTSTQVAEALERAPVSPGDVLIGDRNYLRADGVRAVVQLGGHVLVRTRWNPRCFVDGDGNDVAVLPLVRRLRVGRVGQWPISIQATDGTPIPGRIVAIKLPKPVADRAVRRLKRRAAKQQRRLDARSIEAAQYVVLFTTLPQGLLDAQGVADLYRFRWQIEIAFKRLKQLLRIGQLPHRDPAAAQSWILSKVIVALLLELLYRRSTAISPWAYRFEELARAA